MSYIIFKHLIYNWHLLDFVLVRLQKFNKLVRLRNETSKVCAVYKGRRWMTSQIVLLFTVYWSPDLPFC